MKYLKWSLPIVILLICLAGNADAIKVKYVTGENVYLDIGIGDSLKVGDRLIIPQGDTASAVLEVVFAAEHSASCRIIRQDKPIEIGDLVEVAAREIPPFPVITETEPVPAPASQPIQAAAASKPGPSVTRLSGSLSFQFHRWDDTNPSNLDFSQPGSRLNLQAGNLWGRDLALKVRIVSRYDQRTRAYSANVPKTEWRNRIYQASLSYAGEQAPLHFSLGRIISSKLSGIGYIDGLLVQKSLSPSFQVGGFGGTQPTWQYSGFQVSYQKYGAYVGYSRGEVNRRRLESVLAAAGEYHGGTISREFVFTRNTVALGSRWSLFQSAELDLNRGWRKEKTGQGLSLTNLYLSARGRLSDRVSAGLSFDNRYNYWTYELRSLADSLFDDVLRQGLRADISVRPGRTLFISSNIGYRKRTGDSQATYSYSLGINKNNFLASSLFLNLQAAGFTGPFTDGYNFSVRSGRYFGGGHMISLAYGAYIYDFKTGPISRQNRWFQAGGQFNVLRQVFASGSYEINMGDDSRGQRLLGELGYRF